MFSDREIEPSTLEGGGERGEGEVGVEKKGRRGGKKGREREEGRREEQGGLYFS